MVDVAKRYIKLREKIDDDVVILVATKNRSVEEVLDVVEAGAGYIGENYVYPEAVEKYEDLGDLADSVEWHVIGHLQINKINKALPYFDVIQSVGSKYRAENINKRAKREEIQEVRRENGLSEVVSVFIQVNISGEESKNGVEADFQEIRDLVSYIVDLDYLSIDGLMSLGSFGASEEVKRKEFRTMKEFFDRVNGEMSDVCLDFLSMGTTGDFELAIEEGANMVRIGRGIFGDS